MVQMPCRPSRAACVVVNGGRSAFLRPPSAVGLRRVFGVCNSRSRSVRTLCWSFQPDNVCFHNLILSATSSSCATKLCNIHCRAATQINATMKSGCRISRSFSTSSSLFSSNSPLTIRPASSLMYVACLAPSSVPQLSDEWFALRKDKLTASTFSTALGFWKGTRRAELWREKVFVSDTELPDSSKRAMEWGMVNEAAAVERYKGITGREVSSYGFSVHSDEQFNWAGASPDGLLGSIPGGGILEVKCPYNKGKPEMGLPWKTVPFYYMPQMQGQMEIMDREWVDLYCWMPNGSTIFRIYRERSYWNLMKGILSEFWLGNVIPAREALLLGKEEDAKSYEPSSTHKLTGLVIAKSLKLSNESKLLCREIAGHLEFFR